MPIFVSAFVYLRSMTIKRRRRSYRLLACLECGHVGTLRIIIYGMPDPAVFDFEKYAVGGCCVTGEGLDPDVRCRDCEWEGFRKDL